MKDGLKLCMIATFILSFVVFAGVFITDWFFVSEGEEILNATVVGVLIGAPIGWVGAFTAFYTTEKMKKDKSSEDDDSTS